MLHRDLIAIAKAGDPAPLQDYINNFDLDRAIRVPMTAAQWDKTLPAWKSKTKARGLKSWKSKTSRGEWDVPGICAKVINQAVKTYMQIFGLPPVFEGSEKIIKPNGVDLFTPFILTVHLAYCKNLNPEVEDGTFAFDKLLQYMHTHRVRIKLLRAVCTHQDTHTMHSQDTYPLFQDTYPAVKTHIYTSRYTHYAFSRHIPAISRHTMHFVKMHLHSFKTHTQPSRHIPAFSRHIYTLPRHFLNLSRHISTHQDTHSVHSQDTYPLFQDTYPTVKTHNTLCQDTSSHIQDTYPPIKKHIPTVKTLCACRTDVCACGGCV